MKRVLFVALMTTLIASEAYAEDSNIYLIGEFGSAKYENMYPFPNPGQVGLGVGYHIDQYLAAELGYTIFGDSTATVSGGSATVKASSFHPALVGSLPIGDKFNLFGKFGLAFNRGKGDGATVISWNSDSISNSAVYVAVGAQYNVSKQIGLRFQYERFGKFENKSPAMAASSIAAGILFNL